MLILVIINLHTVAAGEIAKITPDHWVVIFADAFRLRVEDLRSKDRRVGKMYHFVFSDLAFVVALKLAEIALYLVVLVFPLQMQREPPLVFGGEVAKLALVRSIEEFLVDFLKMTLQMAGVSRYVAAFLAGKLGFDRVRCRFDRVAFGRVGSLVLYDVVGVGRFVVAVSALMRFLFEVLSRMRLEIAFVHRCVGALVAFVHFEWCYFLLCFLLFF